MDSLYRNAAETPVESSFVFDGEILAEALKNLYNRRYNPKKEIDSVLFSEVSRIIGDAIDIGFENPGTDSEFINQLKTSADVFAAFKTHRMGRDMAAQLLDEDGQLKSFEQFKEDVAPISSHHIDRWLRTEYDTAVKRAHLAERMVQFRAEKDVLPNLEWQPSTAAHPRELHMPFYMRIWPIDDPFWEDNFPGSLWGCQCGIEATDEPPTDNSDLVTVDIKPSKGLGGNPAVSGHIFSDDHPYHPANCNQCPFSGLKLPLVSNNKKDCYSCKKIQAVIDKARLAPVIEEYERLKKDSEYKDVRIDKKSGGLSAVHVEHNFDPTIGKFGIPRGDYETLATDALRKAGHKVMLASEHAANGVKTPDGFIDGILMDIKAVESVGKYTLKNKFASAGSQKVDTIVLYFHDKEMHSVEAVNSGWQQYLNKIKDGPQTIKRILCIVDGETFEFIP